MHLLLQALVWIPNVEARLDTRYAVPTISFNKILSSSHPNLKIRFFLKETPTP